MSIRRYSFVFLPILLAAILIALPTKPQYFKPQNQTVAQAATVLTSGRNVNMVSGTTLPGGDPWLQRQNEPSIAVSSRNPLHLLAGANDYRTVDMPQSEGDLPGKTPSAMVGDAWLGVFASCDGGESWVSTMLPGYPQDPNANPLKGYRTAADPVVRSGPNGLFYFSGIAFNRDTNLGVVFVARFIDNNNAEGGNTIQYIDTKIIAKGTSTSFLDKPWIAVDQPRIPIGSVTVAGQKIPRHNVYITYSAFSGQTATRGDIMFARSNDCGSTWGTPLKLSTGNYAHQGATIAIKPVIGEVLVAWRRFADKASNTPDSIFVAMSLSRGLNFQNPIKVADIPPFDQPTTDKTQSLPGTGKGTAFRTNSYPIIAVDESGHVYLAWSQRGVGLNGAARIMLSSSYFGYDWTTPQPVANVDEHGNAFLGHQIMPSMSYAAGKLILVWYDQRHDVSGYQYGYNNWILDDMPYRHTMDVWAAVANTDRYPNLVWDYTQVSRYLYSVLKDEGGNIDLSHGQPVIFPVQFNCVNYSLFKGGLNSFNGDYIDVAATPTFVIDRWKNWSFNTERSNSPVFHVAWTDNRDVRPPLNGDWTQYTPPSSSQNSGFITPGRPECGLGGNAPGMRNQNIYTSRITWGIDAGSPTNNKPLNLSGGVARAFVIFVKNNTENLRGFRLTIANQPAGGQASFLQFELLATLDVNIAPYSTISRPVFISSSDPYASVTINVDEIDASGNVIAAGLKSTILINGDTSSPNVPGNTETHDMSIGNPNIVNWTVVNPNIVNPNIVNSSTMNPNIVNPNIVNPNIVNSANPNIVNPNIVNPNIVNSAVFNYSIPNPNIVNPNIVNPNIVNSNLADAALGNVSITDVEWTVKNEGTATSSFTLKTLAKKTPPAGVYAQLLVYKVHYTPAVAGAELSAAKGISGCELKQEPHHELILNVVNPNIVNPNIVNPNIVNPNIVNSSIENATFPVGPGEEVIVDLRVLDTGASTTQVQSSQNLKSLSLNQPSLQAFNVQDFVSSVGFAVTSQAVNSVQASQGIQTPPAAATTLVIGTPSLPDGVVGVGYNATLNAYGGGPSGYSWTLNSGELPAVLTLSGGGLITGTPTTAGTYYFIVRVDSGSQFDTQRYSITINPTSTPPTLQITTTSPLPDGIKGHWYGATLEATGGKYPRTWSLAGGALPQGLSLDTGGVISGTPIATGSSTFTVKVTDAAGTPVTKQLTINVVAATGTITISGTVYNGQGNKLGGVVMRGLPNTPVTDASGYYQDKVPAPWTGTVIPFKVNVTFSPASRTYTNILADQPNQDYNKPLELPPSVTSFSPAPGATDVAFDANLIITFNKAISAGSGNILIKRSSDDVTFETIDVASSQVTINSQVATINPNGTFASLASYYVLINNTCFKDSVGNFHAGINDKTTWSFTTLGYCVVTGPMANARRDFNATILPGNGKVLITGWNQQAELYDPSTGAFSSAGSMVYSHTWRSTATLLPDGRVLIAGGQNSETNAEIYDPSTGNFNQTGGLNHQRSAHTATLLQSGKVLIAAGQENNNTRLNLAEIYDPGTGRFTPTNSLLIQARTGHTATLLQNGKVLIAGGLNSGQLKSAEIYDPTFDTFSSTGDMKELRYGHTAILLSSGKVLVAGGSTGNAELYDPTSGTFSYATHSMMIPARTDHTGTLLLDGKVLLAGGFAGWGGKVTNSAEIYDPITDSFSYTSYMNSPRQEFAASLLMDGRVLLVGGWDGSTEVSSADLYGAIPPPPPVPAGFSVSGNPKAFMNVADTVYKDSMAILAKSAKLKRE
jgi:hypothetical protein